MEQSATIIFSGILLYIATSFGFYQRSSSGTYKILAQRMPRCNKINVCPQTDGDLSLTELSFCESRNQNKNNKIS